MKLRNSPEDNSPEGGASSKSSAWNLRRHLDRGPDPNLLDLALHEPLPCGFPKVLNSECSQFGLSVKTREFLVSGAMPRQDLPLGVLEVNANALGPVVVFRAEFSLQIFLLC